MVTAEMPPKKSTVISKASPIPTEKSDRGKAEEDKSVETETLKEIQELLGERVKEAEESLNTLLGEK